MPDFPGKNEKIRDSECVWSKEEAVLGYQLRWINELNYSLFPDEYENNPAFKALRSFIYGDNYKEINKDYHNYSVQSEGVLIGLQNNIIIDKELKPEKIEEAKKILADLKKFYDANKKNAESIYQKNCKNMAILSDAENQQNLLYMSANSPYGNALLYNVSRKPHVGYAEGPKEGEAIDPELKTNIQNVKSVFLDKTCQELEKCALESSEKLSEAEKNKALYQTTNTELIRQMNRLSLYSTPKKNDKGEVIDDGKAKDREIAKDFVNLKGLGCISPKKIFDITKSENQSFKENWKVEDQQIKVLFDLIEPQLKAAKDYEYAGLYNADGFMGQNGDVLKQRALSKFADLKKKYSEELKNGSAESKVDLIDDVNKFLKSISKVVASKTDWYQSRRKLEGIKDRLYSERADVKAAREILDSKDPERSNRIIDIVLNNNDDVFFKLLEDYEKLEYQERETIYTQLIQAKGRVYDELLSEANKNIAELDNKSYTSALRDGRFGELPEKNKENIIKKMSARIALAARPDIRKKLDEIDFILRKLREVNVHTDNIKEDNILAEKLNNQENGVFYKGLLNRNNPDPELRDIRLVVENIGKSDRIAVVISDEEKNRVHQNARNTYNKALKWTSTLFEIRDFAARNLNTLKLDDPDMVRRRTENQDYNNLISSLEQLKDINTDVTPNQIKNYILTAQLAVMNYDATLSEKAQNHTITDVEKEIKKTTSTLMESLPNNLMNLGNQLTDMGGMNPGDISYKEHTKRKYEEFKKTVPGTESLDRYLKNTEYYNEALRLVKLAAKKALKDMNANKSGNSWQFEELKAALQKVTNLNENSKFADVIGAIKNVNTSANLYVEKSERQIHPFGEPKRTTIARGLCTFTAGIRWNGEQNVPGRPTIEMLLESLPYWADPNQTIKEQAIEIKMASLDESQKRASDAKMFEVKFFNTYSPASTKLVTELKQGDNQPVIPVDLENHRFGRDKVRDKRILADKLNEVTSITKNTPVREVLETLQTLKRVADAVAATNKHTLALINKTEFPRLAERQANLPDIMKIKAKDISALANQMIEDLGGLELSKAEMEKPIKEMVNDRMRHLGKLSEKQGDAYKRDSQANKNADIRPQAPKL